MPTGLNAQVRIGGVPRDMCCVGCQAVAQAIVAAGMESFYTQRDESAPTGSELVPDFLRQLKAYDDPQVQQGFVSREAGHIKEAALILEGISCAACIWLNEQYLSGLPGVLSVSINYSTHRARVRWDERRIQLSEILEAVARIGYRAHPYDPNQQQAVLERARSALLRQLGVAGVFGMQVMMLAVALYGGDWWGMEVVYRRLLSWASLLLTLPIIGYAAVPFFRSAWRDLKLRRAGMDVPVTVGISLAFAISVWHTVQGEGPLYFESVAMFVFFLLTGRYLELAARRKALDAGESLLYARPEMAQRREGEAWEDVIANRLQPGDRVLVRSGESVPADGVIHSGIAGLDEALLTGEAAPVRRGPGEAVVAGSINTGDPLEIDVTHAGSETVLAGIQRLLDAAQSAKPAVAALADRLAGKFVLGVLTIAALVGAWWFWYEPERWLAVTVSVLVVSCPCALSLATPTAITAALARLTRAGFLVKNGSILEQVAGAEVVVFDKTGTLTLGHPEVAEILPLQGQADSGHWLRVAAALEQGASHPLATAIRERAAGVDLPTVQQPRSEPGSGVSGQIAGRTWRLGSHAWVSALGHSANVADHEVLADRDESLVFLGNDADGPLAVFVLNDGLRPGARELIDTLHRLGASTVMLSGDRRASAERTAGELGIQTVLAELSPADKLAQLRSLQAAHEGAVVMIGDGINDAPALAQADASVAMGSGTQLAAVAADAIQMGGRLDQLTLAWRTSRRALRVIRQNLAWALGYNLLAIPAAAAGLVQPWLAALGMSLSSLVVVWNASRLTRS